MVVVRAVPHDDVGLPVADEARHRAAVLERGLEFAVMDVEHVGGDAEDAGALLDLGVPALGQRATSLAEVADVAVRHRDELHLVPLRGPERRHPGGLQLRVVRMGAERDDAERAVLCRLGMHQHGREHERKQGKNCG